MQMHQCPNQPVLARSTRASIDGRHKIANRIFSEDFAYRNLNHRCKKRFFYFGHVFTFFNVFYFPNVFLFLKNVGKVQSGKQINKKHFQYNSNEINSMGL